MKTGGLARTAINKRGAAVAAFIALMALMIAAAVVLVVEHRGQLGTSLLLACTAASGLSWLAGQVSGAGAAHDPKETDRVRSSRRFATSTELKRERTIASAPAAQRAARAAATGSLAGANSRQPGRTAGSADRAAARNRSKIHQLSK